MTDLKEEIIGFLTILRFYLYTDGHEGGMCENERSATLKKIVNFNESSKEWMETNFDFDFRLLNISKCLKIVLNRNPNKKYGEEIILDDNLNSLKEFPVQELIYRSLTLRKSILNKDGDMVKTFAILIERLAEVFRYLEENPSEARVYFAILIGIFCQMDQISNKKANVKSYSENSASNYYLSEYYNAIYSDKSKNLFIWEIIDKFKADLSNMIAFLSNESENEDDFAKEILLPEY